MQSPAFNPQDNAHSLNKFKFYKAVCLVAAGYTKEEIAAKLHITTRTLGRWFLQPAFQESLKLALGQSYRSAIAELTAHCGLAAKKLIEVINDEIVSDKTRLEAIKLLFDIVQKSQTTQPEITPVMDTRNQIAYLQSMSELAQMKPVFDADDKIALIRKGWLDLGFPEDEFPEGDFN
jgi:hypothetical protein